jgi:hypothetical protein
MKKVHQIFDLIRLENVSEGRHRSAAPANLALNPLFV